MSLGSIDSKSMDRIGDGDAAGAVVRAVGLIEIGVGATSVVSDASLGLAEEDDPRPPSASGAGDGGGRS